MHVEIASPFSQAERRRYRRTRTMIPALVRARGRTSEQPRDCVILDLSVGGARIWIENPPPDDANVTLHTRRFGMLDAEVTWRGADLAGLRFRGKPAEIARAMAGFLPEPYLAV